VDLTYGVGGGYFAARLGRASPLVAAFTFGVLAVLLAMLSNDHRTPRWYPIALQLLLVPATVAGGWLHAKRILLER
jgi:hypothetical protein